MLQQLPFLRLACNLRLVEVLAHMACIYLPQRPTQEAYFATQNDWKTYL